MKIMAIIVSSPFSLPSVNDGPSIWWPQQCNVSVGTHGQDFEDAVDVKENSVGDYD